MLKGGPFVALICSVLVGSSAAAGWAAIAVDGGEHLVSIGSSVTFDVMIHTSSPASLDDVEGMTFTVQIGDGLGVSPRISAVDLLNGTIWTGHTSAVLIPAGGDDAGFYSRDLLVDQPGDPVTAEGVLAHVTIDASGAVLGDYPLNFTQTLELGSDSAFYNGNGDPVSADFTAGTIHVVNAPEPMGFAGVAGALVLAARRRRIASRARMA